MISVPGYEIMGQTRSGPGFIRFSGKHIASSRSVSFHFFPAGRAILVETETIADAYAPLINARSAHVIDVHAVEKVTEGPETGILLITAPSTGAPLSEYRRQNKPDLPGALDIAVQLTTAVNDMHRAGFIHKGLTPYAIEIGPAAKTLLVAGFAPPELMGPPSCLYNDSEMTAPGVSESNLPYISPEQTGRMDCRVDFRTDFYAVGIILYELFTGAPPFNSGGPEKIIHEHIAHTPPPPVRIRPDIPEALSDIIMKLLAKDSAQRYQSAYALRADLKSMIEALAGHGCITPSFNGDEKDAPEILMLSDALLGRDTAIGRLKIEFERIRQEGIAMVMVSGCSGMGKTRLMADFEKHVTQAGGYFLKGRCEPLYQNTPYKAIRQAFSGLIRRILTQSPDAVDAWRRRLTGALGANARIIVDVIPDLEYIIGKPGDVTDLPPTEALNRFNITFDNFFRGFAAKDHPLVLFIDNMQWADSATLHQMEAFFTRSAARHILFVGACRPEEISADHPLYQTLASIRRNNVRLTDIPLEPLTAGDIDQLIGLSLKQTAFDTAPLSTLVHQKTGGIPYFIRHFLSSIYTDGLLFYNFDTGAWQWDIAKIRSRAAAGNGVDDMDDKIKKLPENTLAALTLAACIGDRFSLFLLSTIAEKNVFDMAFDLHHAIEDGFLLTDDETKPPLSALMTQKSPGIRKAYLTFRDDTLRQTVYAMLPEDRKKTLHLQIGRLFLRSIDRDPLPNPLFQAVNHLNRGADLVEGRERVRLAELNLAAARKAVEAHAYSQANDYYKTGEALLPPESAWRTHYSLIFPLTTGQMACEYFTRNFDRAEQLFRSLIHRTKTEEDRAEIYTLKMIMLASRAKHEEAMKIGITGLRRLGVNLPAKAGRVGVFKNIISTKSKLRKYNVNDLLNLPQINDRRLLLAMNLLVNLSFSAFLCSPYFAITACLKLVDLTLKYGNSKPSPFGYVVYGASLCAVFKDYNAGRKFGDLALAANDRFGTPALTPKMLLFYGSGISIWTEHIDKGLDIHRRGVKTALETGDTNYAVYHIQSVIIFLIVGGAPVDSVVEECEKHFHFVKNSKDVGALNYLRSVMYYARELQGKAAGTRGGEGGAFDEGRHVENMRKDGIQIILLRHFLLTLRLRYIMGDIKAALGAAEECVKRLHYHLGSLIVPEFYCFHALALAAGHPETSKGSRIIYRRKIKGYKDRLNTMARQCPENFEHKYLLVSAEYERISGRDMAAMPLYHRAMRSARENGFIQHYAIANELASRFYIERHLDDVARICLTNARDAYRKWGASAKAAALDNEFPAIPAGRLPDKTHRAFDQLDFSAVINSIQAISTDIVLSGLLKNLMHIMLENAGATKTQLLTMKADQMVLQAEHDVDSPEARVFDDQPAGSHAELFLPVLNYVSQTGRLMVLEDAADQPDLAAHPYMKKYQPRSVLCLPVLRQSQPVTLLYLENRLAPAVFTPTRVEVLQLLASQAAISLENARLYDHVSQKEKAIRDLARRRQDESLRYQSRLRSLSSRLSLTEERERRRIATELHDRIGHALANASMQLRRLRHPDAPENEQKRLLDAVDALIEQTIQDTQTLTFELSPPVLYDLGLEAAIDWLAEQTQSQHDISVRFVDDTTPEPMDESVRILLFQAVRELLFNVVKHARATQVTISIARKEGYVRIAIEDNGIGFDAAASSPPRAKKGGGFGLFSIKERLAHQGGRLEINSEPGGGTRVTLFSLMKNTP